MRESSRAWGGVRFLLPTNRLCTTEDLVLKVEVNWRRLFLIIGIVALAMLAVVFVSRFLNRSPVEATNVSVTVAPTPASQKAVANVDIALDNRSAWKIEGQDECLPKLSAWIGEQYPLQNLTIVITDTVTPEMSIGAAYPHPMVDNRDPEAIILGHCQEDSDTLICEMAVEKGHQSNALDIAATVEVAELVQLHYLPRTKQAWRQWQRNWKWDNYRPLIRKENDQWISDCFHLEK